MNRIFGTGALVGFSLALATHISALLGINVSERVPEVWLLHLGIFIVFVPFVFSSRKTLGPRPSFAQIRAAFPLWIVVLGVVLSAYAMANFLLFMVNAGGGTPSLVDGKFTLMDHGRLVRELTAAEYGSLKANEVRGFSGHWLVFYFLPFAYFLYRK